MTQMNTAGTGMGAPQMNPQVLMMLRKMLANRASQQQNPMGGAVAAPQVPMAGAGAGAPMAMAGQGQAPQKNVAQLLALRKQLMGRMPPGNPSS